MGLDSVLLVAKAAVDAIGPLFPWVIMVIFVVLLIISIFGNIGIDWSTKKFTFGQIKNEDNDRQKRTCTDCIMLILGKRTIFESVYNSLLNRILRDQMTFAEHKIQEAKYLLLQSYQNDIEHFRVGEPDLARENKEYIIYQECISNALESAKDEIRRSFKENGFHTMEDPALKAYLNERCAMIITLVRDYLRRTYPSTGMIVPIQDRFKRMDGRNINEIVDLISDLYINAKTTRVKIEEEIKKQEDTFISEINALIGDKNGVV